MKSKEKELKQQVKTLLLKIPEEPNKESGDNSTIVKVDEDKIEKYEKELKEISSENHKLKSYINR